MQSEDVTMAVRTDTHPSVHAPYNIVTPTGFPVQKALRDINPFDRGVQTTGRSRDAGGVECTMQR